MSSSAKTSHVLHHFPNTRVHRGSDKLDVLLSEYTLPHPAAPQTMVIRIQLEEEDLEEKE